MTGRRGLERQGEFKKQRMEFQIKSRHINFKHVSALVLVSEDTE
jgi:hypothetical protein